MSERERLQKWICRLRRLQLHSIDEHARKLVDAQITSLRRDLRKLHSPTNEADCSRPTAQVYRNGMPLF